MQLLAKFKQILYLGFRATLNFRKFKMVHILMLLWQHAQFQSPASSKLNITICDSTRQNTWSCLRCMPVPPSMWSPLTFFVYFALRSYKWKETGTEHVTIGR